MQNRSLFSIDSPHFRTFALIYGFSRLFVFLQKYPTMKETTCPIEELPDYRAAATDYRRECPAIDMQEVVGKCDILFVCLDALRYDVAVQEEARGGTPILNRYGKWEKRHAPGTFTYPSHQAMFAGFLPSPAAPKSLAEREWLFYPSSVGVGRKAPAGSYEFKGSNFVEALAAEGYETICVGGVSFFNPKRSDIGKVLPGLFRKSYWRTAFGCMAKSSTERQVSFLLKKLGEYPPAQRLFVYFNVSAIHYPNCHYLPGATDDSTESHAAALRYADRALEPLFEAFRRRGETFVIVCSDHGTNYGEDGYRYHCHAHELVTTVPYKHFMLK